FIRSWRAGPAHVSTDFGRGRGAQQRPSGGVESETHRMSSMFVVLAALSLAAWIWLLLFHGMFWRIREHLDDAPAPSEPAAWPTVVAICPARNEAAVIAPAILSLLSQDYPGRFHVILVDDSSEDGTAEVA